MPKTIINSIKKGVFKPVYFLMGDEPYFIDLITDYIEKNVLSEADKGFNQVVLYGRDTSIEAIIAQAKRFPMMAEHQVVIVKEAQALSRNIEKLITYAENPQPSTILVIAYKGKRIDKRKKLYKTLYKTAVLLDTKKLYDNQVGTWTRDLLNEKGFKASPKAIALIVEFLGTDLSKINNEIGKLEVLLDKGSEITAQHIEEHIGISKDYNVFELRKALGAKDVLKANRIISYFASNPKANPLVLVIGQLNNFFIQLIRFHTLTDKSKMGAASALKISPYFVGEYQSAARNYPLKKLSRIISYLRQADAQSKGVAVNQLSDNDILKELIFKILH